MLRTGSCELASDSEIGRETGRETVSRVLENLLLTYRACYMIQLVHRSAEGIGGNKKFGELSFRRKTVTKLCSRKAGT